MSPRTSIRIIACIALAANIWAVSGCASVPLESPVGLWTAIDEGEGTITIATDGTFIVDGSSFNLVRSIPAVGYFQGEGSWTTDTQEKTVLFSFSRASDDVGVIRGESGASAVFIDGELRFSDVEEAHEIVFRLQEEERKVP